MNNSPLRLAMMAALLIPIAGMQSYAKSIHPVVVVRNGLTQQVAVDMEVVEGKNSKLSNNPVLPAHWELTLNDMTLVSSAKTANLGVKVYDYSNGQRGQEMAQCKETFAPSKAHPQVGVLIFNEHQSTHCEIVDLNSFKSAVAETPAAPARDIALKS